MQTKTNKTEATNRDYRGKILTAIILPVGLLSGYIAHKLFNPLFEQSQVGDNWILPARYSVGYTSILPTYTLVTYLQRVHHGDQIPLWRRMTDFIASGFVVGCGVMIARLFGKQYH